MARFPVDTSTRPDGTGSSSMSTANERCDRCGAPAYVRARLESGSDLTLCGHHGREYERALIASGALIRDDTYLLAHRS